MRCHPVDTSWCRWPWPGFAGGTGEIVVAMTLQYQRRHYERADVSVPLRTLHFGPHDEGLVTFLVYPPDDLVLVVRIQWLGD